MVEATTSDQENLITCPDGSVAPRQCPHCGENQKDEEVQQFFGSPFKCGYNNYWSAKHGQRFQNPCRGTQMIETVHDQK
jgi:hypothetical protein